MKKVLLSMTLLSALFITACGEEKAEEGEEKKENTEANAEESKDQEATLNVNTDASTVKWYSVFKSDSAHYHEGFVGLAGGSVTVKNNQIVSGSFEVDMNSMAETAPKTDSAGLMGHLKSPDFFNVSEFPVASFEITNVAEDGTVTGNMTVLGVTNEISFPATITATADKVVADASFSMNRLNYGIEMMSSEDGTPEEKQIIPEIMLDVHLEASK